MTQPLALIIEDHPMLATIFENALQAAQYQTEIIYDGEQALNRPLEPVPHLILLDMQLPNISGEEILAWIRSQTQFQDTHIFITSADKISPNRLSYPVDGIFTKPVNFQQLRDLAIRLRPKQ